MPGIISFWFIKKTKSLINLVFGYTWCDFSNGWRFIKKAESVCRVSALRWFIEEPNAELSEHGKVWFVVGLSFNQLFRLAFRLIDSIMSKTKFQRGIIQQIIDCFHSLWE